MTYIQNTKEEQPCIERFMNQKHTKSTQKIENTL